ncbi:MAG: hypothetical protein FWH20_00560 [Oscillospiraceae bacterium]|nr:hypothetical protein [Oscillospiraceae bacterium]
MADRNIQMKHHNGTEWEKLFPKTKIEQVEALAALLSELEVIAKGASRARVFATVAALDAWLAVTGNKATLQVGDNFYIEDVAVPDYWWNGTEKKPLSTEKVIIALASATVDGLMSKADFAKLSNIAANANNYTHPTNHPASVITQDANNRFVSDAEKETWNAKSAGAHNHNASEINAGTMPVARGGTNRTSQAAGNINYATSTTATGVIAPPTANVAQVLVHIATTVAGLPVWRNLTGATSLRNDLGLGTGTESIAIITASATAPASPKTGDVWYDFSN